MDNKYILDDDGQPVLEPDLYKWGQWYEDNRDKRRVGDEKVGPARISTVFLGLDYAYGDAPPAIWETMVFGGSMDQEMDRCGGSRKQAEAMHAHMVKRVKESQHRICRACGEPMDPTTPPTKHTCEKCL